MKFLPLFAEEIRRNRFGSRAIQLHLGACQDAALFGSVHDQSQQLLFQSLDIPGQPLFGRRSKDWEYRDYRRLAFRLTDTLALELSSNAQLIQYAIVRLAYQAWHLERRNLAGYESLWPPQSTIEEQFGKL